MRTLMTTVAILGALGATTAAYAADATGNIKQLRSGTLTLTDGEAFKLSSKVKTSGFKVGDKVTVSYAETGKNKMVTDLKIAK